MPDVIAFEDEDGVRWTVTPRRASRSGTDPAETTLVFTSESGQRRTCEACLPEGASWDDVDERVWWTLLRHAEAAPDIH